jgi:hypothetical protein
LFNSVLGGRAALVAPVRIAGHTIGLLGLVWSEAREGFADHEVALVEGIADQIGTALERDQLSAEIMNLRSALHERYGEDRIIGQTAAIRRAIELALSGYADHGFDRRRVRHRQGTARQFNSLQLGSRRSAVREIELRRDSGDVAGVGIVWT